MFNFGFLMNKMQFLNKLSNKEKFIIFFILKALVLYLLWYLVYESYLSEKGYLDNFLIQHLVNATEFFLNLFGYTTFKYADAVGIDGTHGVMIGPNCNGISLFALFTGFILLFPGNLFKKFIYIILGNIFIHFINILRIVALAIVVLNNPESLEFNHKYTFTSIVYLFIFFLWLIWVNKFSLYRKK
jgi:exosortase family protein XrtF